MILPLLNSLKFQLFPGAIKAQHCGTVYSVRLFFLLILSSTIYMCAFYTVSEKIVPFFIFFFLGAQCVESGVSCNDCY